MRAALGSPQGVTGARAEIDPPIRVLAFETALKLGNTRVQNTVMLGAVSCFLEFPEEAYRQAITRLVKPKVVELNLKAFCGSETLHPRLGTRPNLAITGCRLSIVRALGVKLS